MQKKIFIFLMTLIIFLTNSLNVFADNNKPPRANVFNRAVKKGDVVNVEKYLKAGFNPNKKYWTTWFLYGTPIIGTAITNNQNEMLDLLLENGADVNPKSICSPLFVAAMENNSYAVKKLLEAGADQNKTYMGLTPEELAIQKKYTPVINAFNEFNNKAQIKTNLAQNAKNIPSSKLNYTNINSTSDKTLKAYVTESSKKGDGLIEIKKIKKINAEALRRKKNNDNLAYKKYKSILTEDQYKLYTILDKIIRANKLQYQNWRIGINISPEDINAKSVAYNLIVINSALYDSIYQDEDALAFVLSHEIAHFLLGHHQISTVNSYKIQQLQNQVAQSSAAMQTQNNLSALNNATGNYYGAMGNSVSGLLYAANVASLNNEINNVYKQERFLEYQADEEAINLLVRAGFNKDKAVETFSLLSSLPNIYTNRSTHPDPQSRLVSVNKIIQISDIERLKNEGDNNIYNSNILTVKKSSDKSTIILEKSNAKLNKYIPETRESKLLQLGYKNYLNNNLRNAENLFIQAYNQNQANYLPMLYLSYINEYYYNDTGEKKYLKIAQKWIKKAYKIDQNQFIIEQQEDIKSKLKSHKKELTNK